MGDLSPHFSTYEFTCHHCGRIEGPTASLLAVLEHIRTTIGRPLPILSGYRCPTHNRAIAGARRSQHLLGRAADFKAGLVSVAQARAAGARGIGVCAGWVVHVDVRTVAAPLIFDDC